jgi:leader peptidase (prepilin peptidase) / N-methyltransferase
MLGRSLSTKGETAILASAGDVPGWLVTIFVVLVGLAFGSFLNVCISRLPRHESIVRPRSRCPKCGVPIRAHDNVPILSWLLLRGRCRACGWRIPWRYPAVEVANTALFLICFLRLGVTRESIAMAFLCSLLLGLAVMDAESLRLPDAFVWPGIGLGMVWSGLMGGLITDRIGNGILPSGSARTGSEPWLNLPLGQGAAIPAMVSSAIWALAAALLILAIRGAYWLVRRREGMGWGDVKLLAMIATWLGPALTLLTLFLGVVAAAFVGVVWIGVRGRRGAMTMRLPFGSFLCAAAIYAIFAGAPIIEWYMKFFR